MPANLYQLSQGPDEQAMAVVRQGLEAFNAEQIGDYAYADFQLYARRGNQVVGGMFGHSGMGWLYIDYLWLDGQERGQGLGKHLLQAAEDEARSRDCQGVFLYTYSFQAPDFYQKQGYTVLAQTAGFPDGVVKFLMQRIDA